MAAANWRTGHDLTAVISSPDTGWNFLQLVRLLLQVGLRFNGSSDNALLEALGHGVKFQASLQADFPPGEIRSVDYRPGTDKVKVTAVEGGLADSNGPLPEPFITWMKTLDDSGDGAMKDFVNLFGNRLLALRYLVGRSTRPALMDVPTEKTFSGQLLKALTGLTPQCQVQERWNPAWDLGAAGLLANRRLSLPVARYLLKFSLGLHLQRMNALQGGWLYVDRQDHAVLGRMGRKRLGMGTALGRKVWDQHKGIELELGPITWQQLRQLIPGGERHEELKAVVHRITDRRCDCKITLLWLVQEIPAPALGSGQNLRNGVLALGYTAALPARTAAQPQVLKCSFMLAVSA